VSLAGCGGVRDRINALDPPASTRFDARELIDVLPAGRILAIDEPSFEQPALAGSWLRPAEPVAVVAVGQDARAYPLAILVWHEVVNDTIGGVPVAVTYSPLADAAVAFDRRVGGRAESFGVSGKLYRSNLVMVDRRTTSLWTQLDGRAVAGPSKGARLTVVPAQIASFAAFRSAYPTGGVLARPGESGRAYGFNPYARYDSRTAPFGGFIALAPDRRLNPMERIVGVSVAGETRALRSRSLRQHRVTLVGLGARPVVVFWEPGTRSALDAADISEGRAVGSSGVFDPGSYGGFYVHPATDSIRDRKTDSTWSVLGVAAAGPLKGTRLTPIAHVDTFWFAWAAFYPGSST
jgi:hypothetical protein